MELKNTGYANAVGMQASAVNKNAVGQVELVEPSGQSTKDENSGSDSIHIHPLGNQDKTGFETEPRGEADCEEDAKEKGGEAVEEEKQEGEEELAEQNAQEAGTVKEKSNVKAESKEETGCGESQTIVQKVKRPEEWEADVQKEAADEEKSEDKRQKRKMVDQEIQQVQEGVDVVGESSAGSKYEKVSVRRNLEPKWYKAAMEGKEEILGEYMEELNWPSRMKNNVTPAGNTILHIHVAAPVKARKANLAFLEIALSDSNVSLPDMRNDRNETPLHTAANFGQIDAVKLFLKKDPSLLDLINVEGDTALHMAARNKQEAVVEHLWPFSKSEGKRYSTNYAGETPLYLAVQTGCLKLVTVMLDAIDKDQQLGSERTGSILHSAVLWGNSEMTKKILKNNHEIIAFKDEAGQTAVHYAAGIDNDILRVIIEQEGDESPRAAYIRDNEGRTAAHIAAQQNNIDGLKFLMDHFPDCCEIADNQGRNVVHYAAHLGRIEALDFFIRDVRFCDLINKTDNNGNAPLHLLAKTLIDLPHVSLRHLQLLLPELKALQLNIYNNKNLTPGDIANEFKIFELEPAYQDIVRDFRAVAPKGGRVKHWIQPLKDHKDDIEAQRKDVASSLLKTVKFHMVVSTLIATVSFTAGLAVPGGYNQDAKDNLKGGSAVLGNKVAFKVFLISDCIALAFSLLAILCYFWIAVRKVKGFSKILFFRAFEASTISIIALMVAFTAGTYSILQPYNKAFALSILWILSTFICLYVIFAFGVIQLRRRMNRLMSGPQLQNMKGEVLHGQVDTHYVPIFSPLSHLGLLRTLHFPRLNKILLKTFKE